MNAYDHGSTIVENSILSAKHYNRAIQAYTDLCEAIHRFQYKEFFKEKGVKLYSAEITVLQSLKKSTIMKDSTKCKVIIDNLAHSCKKMFLDFKEFKKRRREESENFKFWDLFLNRHEIVLDLVRADREGNWELHLDAMQRSLYEFAAWDSTDYSRWGSVYLEEARNLHKTHPDIYENFMRVSFSIKDTDHRFVAVGGDQKLEQTINLSSKCSDSIIGHSKQKQYFTKWNLIYHEMMSLKNFYREYANVPASTDAYQHHRSSVTFTKKHDAKIQAMAEFIEEKGSPFSSNESNLHLHNFVTKEVMTEEIKKDLLNASLTGKNKYNEFRHDRFIEKTSRISGTIHRRNLRNMKQIKEPTNAKKDADRSIKNHKINEKSLNVARERGLSNEKILEHDIVPSNMIFKANGLITKPSKRKLIIELEKHLTLDECEFSMKGISASIVDVMNVMRKLPTSVSTFDEFIKMFKNGCYENSRRCDYVFDIYDDEPSVKDSEKQRRSQKPPIQLSTIRGDTQFPKDEASFWSSIQNKSNLQKLIYEEVKGHKSEHPIVIGEVESSIEYPEWQAIRVQTMK